MDFLSALLNYYQLNEEQYEFLTRPLTYDDLRFDRRVRGLEPLLARIHKAIDDKEKIIVYGDYDCDGIMSTSIIVKVFEMLGHTIGYYVPSRYIDGYGLNVKRVEEIAKKGYTLIITVDNGVSAFEAISLAKQKGIDTIVVDHHEMQGEKLPDAVSVLHPFVSHLGEYAASGGFLSFLLATPLLPRLVSSFFSPPRPSSNSPTSAPPCFNRDVPRLTR